MIYKKLVDHYLPFAQKQLGFNNIPKINYIEDEENAKNPVGNTGFYDPATMEISVYVTGRHPKDILRSVSHELVHHAQNCNGEFTPEVMGEAGEGYAQRSRVLRKLEILANAKGNMSVRDAVDGGLFNNFQPIINVQINNENKQKGIKQMIDLDALTDAIMEKILSEKHDCNSHKGMTHQQYVAKRKDKQQVNKEETPLNEWLSDERFNLLKKKFIKG